MRALLLVVAAACAGPNAGVASPPPPQTADADCARVGTTIVSVLHTDADHAPAVAAVVEHHCRADAWTPAARACVAAAVDHAAANDCAYRHLTAEQHDLVDRDLKPLVGSPAGHDAVDDASARAQKDRDDAVRASAAANEEAERAAREVASIAAQLRDAEAAVAAATNAAERNSAEARLDQLHRSQAEAMRRAAAPAAAAAHAARVKGVQVSPECQANPLAKGCS